MKKYLLAFLGMITTCALAQTPAPASASASAKPVIILTTFENKTGGAVSRIKPGTYKSVRGSGTSGVPNGRRVNSDTGNWDDVPERDIEVIPTSGRQLPEQAAEVATNAVKAALTDSGKFTVVDYSGSVEATIAEIRATMLSEDCRIAPSVFYVLYGSINNYRVIDKKSIVYGVRHWSSTIAISLDIKLLNAETREIIASKTMSEKLVRNIPDGMMDGGLNDEYEWEEPLRKAIGDAMPKFIASINVESGSGTMTPAAPTVSFEVTSTPTGADVEYNNTFVGNTPCTVTATASPGILRVSLAGYEP